MLFRSAIICASGPVAQSVEQRTENPCVGGSIPPQATSIQSQLFSVGFVASGLSPRHAGIQAVLRVPRRPWRAEKLPTSTPFRFRFALCSQKIMENRVDLAHAEGV